MREPTDSLRQTTPPAVHASPVAALKALFGETWLRTYGVALAMGVFLSLIGANGTTVLPLVMRLGYWLSLMCGGTLIAQFAGSLLDRLSSLNIAQEIVAMMALIVPPITLLVWLVTAGFTGQRPELERLPLFVVPVAIISLAMTLLHVLVNQQPAQSHAFAPEAPAGPARVPGERLRERLPFKFRTAEINALSSEDHYLRVYSSAGETLVLMRLYDAIAELDGIEGSQIHRSWWVAKDAVTDVVRADGRISLSVRGGVTAPVSRGYVKALKDGGWF